MCRLDLSNQEKTEKSIFWIHSDQVEIIQELKS